MTDRDDEHAASLLVVILDINPLWWSNHLQKYQDGNCLDAVIVFCNMHLSLDPRNKLAVVASYTNTSKFLYPLPDVLPTTEIQDNLSVATGDESNDCTVNRPMPVDGRHELLAQLDDTIVEKLKDLMLNSDDTALQAETRISGAIGLALCYIHRVRRESKLIEKYKSRIVVIQAGEDPASQYLPFMNSVFSAQKMNVEIDACMLEKDSGLLQQGCDITGGIYVRVPQVNGLLQYLLWIFLPSQEVRSTLVLPPRVQVDYRAACFCHRNLIDIGYVCSVCLSVFCNFSPICSTCHSTFKIPGRSAKAKKKKPSFAQQLPPRDGTTSQKT